MDRIFDFVGLRGRAPQGTPQPQQAQQHSGVPPMGRGHALVAPAPVLTPAMQAIMKSAETALQSVAETKTLLKNLMGARFDALALTQIEQPQIRRIAIQLFGVHSPLMAPVGYKEDGVVYCSFLVPTREFDHWEVLYLAEALEIAAPDIAAELCASAAMGPDVPTNDRIWLLEKCATLVHEKDVVLCPLTLNELAKYLARACENKGQEGLAEHLFQLICDSVLPPEDVESLTESLVDAFNESLRHRNHQDAEEVLDLLRRLPYAQCCRAAEQLLAELAAMDAQCELDVAEAALGAAGFQIRMEDRRAYVPRELRNSAAELDSEAKTQALIEYTIKLAAIPGFEQQKFCMLFDYLRENASLSKNDRRALQAAHCRVLACFVRDNDSTTERRLQLFRQDLIKRLRDSIQESATALKAGGQPGRSRDLMEWAETHLDLGSNDGELPRSTLRIRESGGNEDLLRQLLDDFTVECLTVCAHASTASAFQLLEPILELVRCTCVTPHLDVMTACMDVIDNPKAPSRLRETAIQILYSQVKASVFIASAEIRKFLCDPNGLLYTRVAKVLALRQNENHTEDMGNLLLTITNSYSARNIYRYVDGFRSKTTLPQIAVHMVNLSSRVRENGPVAFYEEMLGEYLYRFMQMGAEMRSEAKEVLVALAYSLSLASTSLILGATHNGEPAEVHALLQLSLECDFDVADLLPRLVSDLLLELAHSGQLDALRHAIALVRKKPEGTLEIWAVTYVRAVQRKQLVLSRLMRAEILQPDLELLLDDRDLLVQIEKMAYLSLGGLQYGNPRRPSLHPDAESRTEASRHRVMKKLKRLLMLRK
jgi:hypothetical protein